MLQQLGKWTAAFGAVLLVVGGLLYLAGRLGMGRLPGDISFGGRNWRVYLPLGTSILLSIVLTLTLWLIFRWRR